MTGEEYEDYLNQWRALPNANVYALGNYYDLFKTSDLLITDCSSFLAEYFVSKKPIILLESKSRIPFNKFGLKLKTGMYKPENINEIEDLLNNILINKNDPLEKVRENIIKKDFYLPPNGIGHNIVTYLKKELRIM